MEGIYCSDCGEKLSKEDRICPKCGSGNATIMLEPNNLYLQVGWKTKEKGSKKPNQESKAGDMLYRKEGKRVHREISIDRKNDTYKEIVKDKVTGEIIHQCEEPLSQHKWHGDAKHKKDGKKDSECPL